MEFSYEAIAQWFDTYFKDVRENQGDLATVPLLKKYFASDLKLTMHTAPSRAPMVMSRDALLISFIHPGLQEDIVPRDYIIDLRQRIVAVQFEIQFRDVPSAKKWAPIQASAHYHLAVEEKELKIRRIEYWTEALPAEVFEIWAQRRADALSRHATQFINAGR